MRWRVIVTAFFMISLMATEAERSAKSFELQKLTGGKGWLAPLRLTGIPCERGQATLPNL